MLAMNLEICLCFLSSSNLESYRCYLHRTWKLSRYTVKYNHDFQTSIASNHLNDKWGVSASNQIFSSCSSPPELTGPGGFLCYWTSGQLFSTDYFYPLPVSKGCSALNMHQLNLLIQETGMYGFLSVYGKAHSIYVHKQMVIPIRIREILIMSFQTVKLLSPVTMQSALEQCKLSFVSYTNWLFT